MSMIPRNFFYIAKDTIIATLRKSTAGRLAVLEQAKPSDKEIIARQIRNAGTKAVTIIILQS
jgi:hypothetical protein